MNVRHCFIILIFAFFMALLSGCGEKPVAEVDILASLPAGDYDTILWFSPTDYLDSDFVDSFKADAGFVMPLIAQYLGFHPEKITERYGFPLATCNYVSVFVTSGGDEIAVLWSTLEDKEIARNMQKLLGFELAEMKSNGHIYYEDTDVERGYYRSGKLVLVADSQVIRSVLKAAEPGDERFQSPLLDRISSQEESLGFSSVPLAAVDTANVATQLAKFEEDQEQIDAVTAALAGIDHYQGSFQLADRLHGSIAMRCASQAEAAMLGSYLTEKYPEITERLAKRAVNQVKDLSMFFSFVEEDVTRLLQSFEISSEEDRLIVSIDMAWERLEPFFRRSNGE